MKKFFIVVTALAGSFAGHTQANHELTTLINQSFGYYPNVKEAQNASVSAQQRLDLTTLGNMPTVSGEANYAYVQPKIVLPFPSGPNGEIKDFQFAAVNVYGASVGGSYTLADFGRLKADIEKAKTDLQFSKHNIDFSKSSLALQVATVYYNIIFFKKSIQIQDSIINFLNQNLQIVESKLKNGDAIRVDVLNIQAQVDIETNRKVDLQNSLQKQIILLAYTTGDTTTIGNNFDFDIPIRMEEAAMAEAQVKNPDFLLAKDRIKLSQNDLSIARLINKPYVDLGANVGVKNNYVPNVNDPTFNYNAGVNLHVPIYNGGRTKQQIKIAETGIKQSQLAMETLSNDFKKDISQALTDIQSNLDRIKNTEGQINQNRVAMEITGSRFKNGVATNLDLTNASTNLQRAAFTRLQYEYQLCLAKLQLANLMGYQYW
jgi:outer membrane protein TolC